MTVKARWNELAAVFATAFASLLFEITATKIVGFSLWTNYAFFIISTAMFGLGLSGVILTRWPRLLNIRDSVYLPSSSAGCAAGMVMAFFVLNAVPIHFPDAPKGWGRELTNMGVVFLALGTPFSFVGFLMSYLFRHRGEKANVYYFADLVGAGLGSLAMIPLIHQLEPQGLVAFAASVALLATALFLLGRAPGARRLGLAVACLVAAVAGTAVVAPRMSGWVRLQMHVQKRTFNADMQQGRLEQSGWSALSRIDIAPMGADRKRVWIDGGMNESSVVRFDGDFDALRRQREATIAAASTIVDHKALPHLSKTNHTVCMIGTSGGEDSIYALTMGARKVVGVEMDPLIVHYVTDTYHDFAGGLFTDGDSSEIVVDEGRSYLRRAGRQFDVIQQVNNFTPIAFQNGALNLSETYLLTVESFHDFYNSLTDDGILSISRYGSIKCLATAVEMFRRMGMKPEEYSKHLVVTEGSQWIINTFMMKKSAFTPEEVDRIFAFFKDRGRSVLYAPYRTSELLDPPNNLYLKVATSDNPGPLLRFGPFDFRAATDNKPFFNRLKALGVRDVDRGRYPQLPGEVRFTEWQGRFFNLVPHGDIPPLVVLLEAVVLSLVFFGLPLLSKRELRESLRRGKGALGYFAVIGLAFMFVEICLFQRLILFLGAPVYSLSIVLCSILVWAGIGSLCSGLLPARFSAVRGLLPVVAAMVLLTHFLVPPVTQAFLGRSLGVRMVVACLLIGLPGFCMGMPMALGIRLLKDRQPEIIPWAWAINGFFTVIASALSVVLAMQFGFLVVFAVATVLYAVAPLFLRSSGPGEA